MCVFIGKTQKTHYETDDNAFAPTFPNNLINRKDSTEKQCRSHYEIIFVCAHRYTLHHILVRRLKACQILQLLDIKQLFKKKINSKCQQSQVDFRSLAFSKCLLATIVQYFIAVRSALNVLPIQNKYPKPCARCCPLSMHQ